MNKKAIVALVLALVLCMTSVVAFAAGSKTTKDVVKVTTTTPTTETKPTEITVGAATAESKAELDAISAFVNEGKPVAEYFGLEEPTVKLDEFFAITGTGDGTQPVTMTLSTAASYKADAKVIVLIGIPGSNGVQWTKVACSVVGGQIVATIPADLASALAAVGGSGMMAVLSDAN